jgi:hypothetical protein
MTAAMAVVSEIEFMGLGMSFGAPPLLHGYPKSNKIKSNWVKKFFSGCLVTMEDF